MTLRRHYGVLSLASMRVWTMFPARVNGLDVCTHNSRSINKIQNCVIELVFKAWKIRNVRSVENLIASICWEFHKDDSLWRYLQALNTATLPLKASHNERCIVLAYMSKTSMRKCRSLWYVSSVRWQANTLFQLIKKMCRNAHQISRSMQTFVSGLNSSQHRCFVLSIEKRVDRWDKCLNEFGRYGTNEALFSTFERSTSICCTCSFLWLLSTCLASELSGRLN